MFASQHLIVIGGFAGSGKSTLAKKLGHHFSIPVFEIDELAHTIKTSNDFHGESREAYGIAFDLFFAFARRHLQQGSSLILDQNMGHALTWENVRIVRDTVPTVAVKIFLLDCPYDLCVTRVATRTAHPNLTEVTPAHLDDHKYKWEYVRTHAWPDAIRIDATRDPETVFQAVLNNLQPPFTSPGVKGQGLRFAAESRRASPRFRQ